MAVSRNKWNYCFRGGTIKVKQIFKESNSGGLIFPNYRLKKKGNKDLGLNDESKQMPSPHQVSQPIVYRFA